MSADSFLKHARTFAGLTLVSRVLGLVRDAVIVRLLGVSGLGTAFNIAFQFPNTFRRLFGEGALSAALIPEYARLLKSDPARSHRFASLTVALLGAGLGALTLLLVAALGAALALGDFSENGRRALVMLAIMLPYMPLVCVTAALGGMLQTHGRFAAQAGAPIILNLFMIAAAVGGSRVIGADPPATALMVCAAVTLAGIAQVFWCLRDLRAVATWTRSFDGAGENVRRMLRKMGPVVIGLGAIQLATLLESWVLISWPLYMGPTIAGRPYPLDEAAGAALGNAQRLYQFPLGIFGIALATAVFPLLARQADDGPAFVTTLRQSLRLALFIGLPSTLGLWWVAHDLTAVVFLGGNVSAEGAARMAECLRAYAWVVGSYSVTHVLTRAFYAKGDTTTPSRVSVLCVFAGLALGAGLMFPYAERGLAIGSSIGAVMHLVVLLRLGQKRLASRDAALFDRQTIVGIARTVVVSLVMLAALAAWRDSPLIATPQNWGGHAVRLAAEVTLGVLAFGAAALALARQEVRWMLDRRSRPRVTNPKLTEPTTPE